MSHLILSQVIISHLGSFRLLMFEVHQFKIRYNVTQWWLPPHCASWGKWLDRQCLYISSKLSRPKFEFSLKVMGLNPDYLLKSFLLYQIRLPFQLEGCFVYFSKICKNKKQFLFLCVGRYMSWVSSMCLGSVVRFINNNAFLNSVLLFTIWIHE